jgi:hypothetical protein
MSHLAEAHGSVVKLEELDDMPTLVCDFCDSKFASLKEKRVHVREVHEPPDYNQLMLNDQVSVSVTLSIASVSFTW